ncbi:MAG: ABC transporter substrate-binding protein [Acidimicrobiales bacterium]
MRSWTKFVVPIAALTLVGVAANATTTSAGTTVPDDTAASDGGPLGTPNAASGDPVRIGLLTNKGSESLESQGQLTLDGATIAAQYVNEYLGGIGGRPLELFDCGMGATPELATDCANQMVEQNVSAVILPFTGSGSVMVPIITGAGIPYVTLGGSAPEELTTPGSFSIGGGYVASLGTVAQHASEQGFESMTHIVIDVPSAVQTAEGLGGDLFGAAGVEYQVVTAPPGTPDLTPQVQAAAGDGTGAIMVTGDITFCTAFLQAYGTLGLTNPRYIIATCISSDVAESVPGAYEGAFLPTTVDNQSADADLYAAILDEYAADEDIDPDPTISNGIANGMMIVIDFARAMEGVTDTSAAGVLEQMQTVTDVPLFLGGDATFTCDGTAISILPNVCSAAGLIGVLDETGTMTSATPVDPGPLFDAAFG